MFDGPFYASPAPTVDRPSTSLMFVRSRDFNTVAKNPSSLGGGEADKHLIYEGLSRVMADAILAGAETMRSGNIVLSTWHPEIERTQEEERGSRLNERDERETFRLLDNQLQENAGVVVIVHSSALSGLNVVQGLVLG